MWPRLPQAVHDVLEGAGQHDVGIKSASNVLVRAFMDKRVLDTQVCPTKPPLERNPIHRLQNPDPGCKFVDFPTKQDRNKRAYLAACLVYVLKLHAPESPFTDSEIEKVFHFILDSILNDLQDPSK